MRFGDRTIKDELFELITISCVWCYKLYVPGRACSDFYVVLSFYLLTFVTLVFLIGF